MNIGRRIKEARAKASGRANKRSAKKLQNLKVKRTKQEGKAKLRTSISKERGRINKAKATAKGTNFIDRINKAKNKVDRYKDDRETRTLKKLKREVAIEKLKRQREKLKGTSTTKKQIINIGNGGGGLF